MTELDIAELLRERTEQVHLLKLEINNLRQENDQLRAELRQTQAKLRDAGEL